MLTFSLLSAKLFVCKFVCVSPSPTFTVIHITHKHTNQIANTTPLVDIQSYIVNEMQYLRLFVVTVMYITYQRRCYWYQQCCSVISVFFAMPCFHYLLLLCRMCTKDEVNNKIHVDELADDLAVHQCVLVQAFIPLSNVR